MKIDPVGNNTYISKSRKGSGDASAKIDTTDSFQKSGGPSQSMKNLADTFFGKGKELTEIVKKSGTTIMESSVNKNEKMTIQTIAIPKKDSKGYQHLISMSDGTIAGVRGRDKGTSGKSEYTLVFMKPTLGEKKEVILNTEDHQQTALLSTPDGRLLARDGDQWRCFSSDGKEMWQTPYTKMGLYGKSLTVANDGTVISWSKDEKDQGIGHFKASAIAPDGTKKWEKSIRLGSQHVDANGNIYRYFSDKNSYTKIDVNGNETEVPYSKGQLPSNAKIHNFEVTDSGKVIMQMKMEVPGQGFGTRSVYPKYIMDSTNKPIPLAPSSFQSVDGVVDGPNGSTIAVSKDSNYNSSLIFYDKDGKKTWQKQLPKSNLQNKPFVDNEGRIFVLTNSIQRPRNMFSSASPPESALTCYDKDGNKIWQHDMQKNFYADQAMVYSDGSIAISDAYHGKMLKLKPGVDDGKEIVKELLKNKLDEGENSGKTDGIQKSADGKSINIGGVQLPVRQFRFVSDMR